MRKIILLLLLIVNIWAVELRQEEALKIAKCDVYTINNSSYLWRLFNTSSYQGFKNEDSYILCNDDQKKKILCILMGTSGEIPPHSLGSIEFNLNNGELTNSVPDIPEVYTYNSIWKDIVMSVYNNPERSYVQLNQKSYLYNKPNDDAKSDKFLIKNDCALVIKKTKDWYLLYYHNTKLKTDTLLWMKAEDVLK